jgi:hypothetical protein
MMRSTPWRLARRRLSSVLSRLGLRTCRPEI